MADITAFGCSLDGEVTGCRVTVVTPEVVPSYADVTSDLSLGGRNSVRGRFSGGAEPGENMAAAQEVTALYELPARPVDRACVAPDITIRGDLALLFADAAPLSMGDEHVEMEITLTTTVRHRDDSVLRSGTATLQVHRLPSPHTGEHIHTEPVNIKTLDHPLLVTYPGDPDGGGGGGGGLICEVSLLLVMVCIGQTAAAFDLESRRSYGIRLRGLRVGMME